MAFGSSLADKQTSIATELFCMSSSNLDPSTSSTTASSKSQPPPPLTAFERWRQKASLVTGLGTVTEEQKERLLMDDCSKRKAELLETSEYRTR
jgi:mitochondrial inner membrane protease ATP23